jgi:uncharacterized protein (DUF169 family)
MKELKKIVEELTSILRLQSYPIGVKLFEKATDVPPIFKKPTHKVNACQLAALTRQHGLPVAGGASDMVCIAGAVLLGLLKMPERLSSGELCDSYHANRQAAKKKMEFVPCIDNIYEAIGFFPLGKNALEPDVILIYGNSAQMMRLIHASLYHDGKPLDFTTIGEFACAYSIAYPFIKGVPHLTIPCYGERKYTQLPDDQIIFSFPYKMLGTIIEGLVNTYKKGVKLPIPYQLDFFPAISEPWHIKENDLK